MSRLLGITIAIGLICGFFLPVLLFGLRGLVMAFLALLTFGLALGLVFIIGLYFHLFEEDL